MKINDILAAIRTKRRRCIGLSFFKGTTYYAVSGNDDNPIVNKVANEIEKMIGYKKICRCYIQDSFAVLYRYNYHLFYRWTDILLEDMFKGEEDRIYNDLNAYHKISYIFPEYFGTSIRFKPYMRNFINDYWIREYSCVERKIIGKIKHITNKVYVGINPCYACLPAIRRATYLDRYTKRLCKMTVWKRNNTFYFRLKNGPSINESLFKRVRNT